jgi:hypothetical protein
MLLIPLTNKIRQFAHFTLTFFLVLSIVLSKLLDNEGIFGIGVIIVSIGYLWLFIGNLKYQFKLKKWISNKKSNMRILLFEVMPTPADSLFNALNRFDIKVEDIDSIDFMCYFIDHSYVNATVDRLININPNIKIKMEGFRCYKDVPLEHQDKVEYLENKLPLTEHFNYIKTKNGEKFVWYEPYHSIEGDKHIMPKGAYLAQMLSN